MNVKNHKGHHKSYNYKEESIKIAKELLYDDKVIKMIKEAKTEKEITNILHDARNGLI